MPRIFDNIEKSLLPSLQETLQVAERADFCVGYFNLRGWHHLAGHVDRWAGGDGQCCRLLVGMHVTPTEELRRALRAQDDDEDALDNQTARLNQHAEELMTNLRATADTRQMKFRHDRLEIECIIPKRSKRFIDNIDLDVANGFNFSAEETDFIINYDIKYRMGGADDDE